MDGKYYKVLGGEAKSPCTLFDYTPYLPTENSAGAWLPRIDDAEMSGGGYYVSKYWNMWSKTRFAAVQSAFCAT